MNAKPCPMPNCGSMPEMRFRGKPIKDLRYNEEFWGEIFCPNDECCGCGYEGYVHSTEELITEWNKMGDELQAKIFEAKYGFNPYNKEAKHGN
jgi:hypothetical protein